MQVKRCRYCRYSLQARTTATARLSPRTATATTACAAPASAGRGTTTTPAPRPPSSTSTEGQQQRRVWLVTSLLSYCHLDINVQCSVTMIKRSNKCTYQILLCMICISAPNRPIRGGRYLGHSSRRPRPGLEAAGAGAGCIDSPQLLASRSRQDSRTRRGPAAGMDHYCGHYI